MLRATRALFLRHPVVTTAVLSLLCILLATAAAAWGYETYGRYSPGLAYQIEVTIVISTVLAPSFLYPIIVLASRLRRATDKLQLQATTDSTTGLPNTYAISQELSKLLNRASAGRAVALHFIDLDRFKPVNDLFGHDAGDRVLCATAARIQAEMRMSDFIARTGGDEFVMVLESTEPRRAASLVSGKILQASAKVVDVDGSKIQVGTSIGIAIYPDDSTHADDLLKCADKAMYQAKNSGRNNYRFYRG